MPLRRREEPADHIDEIDEAVAHAWHSAQAARHAGDTERAQIHMQFIDELIDRRNQITRKPNRKA